MKNENAFRNACIDKNTSEELRSQDSKSIIYNFYLNYPLHMQGSGVAAIRDLAWRGEIGERENWGGGFTGALTTGKKFEV